MSVLPEVSDIPALSVDYFPTPWQAALFRCWGRQRSFNEISAIAGFVSDLSAAILAAPRLSKTHGELERAEALSNLNRARRRVRRVRGDFIAGKSHFPERKFLPCRFCARGFRRNPSKIWRGWQEG